MPQYTASIRQLTYTSEETDGCHTQLLYARDKTVLPNVPLPQRFRFRDSSLTDSSYSHPTHCRDIEDISTFDLDCRHPSGDGHSQWSGEGLVDRLRQRVPIIWPLYKTESEARVPPASTGATADVAVAAAESRRLPPNPAGGIISPVGYVGGKLRRRQN